MFKLFILICNKAAFLSYNCNSIGTLYSIFSMKHSRLIRFFVLILFPASAFAQKNPQNNPVQQVVNYNNVNTNISGHLNNNIQVQTNVNSDNENIFVIQTTVTGIEISENEPGNKQQFSTSQVNTPPMNMQQKFISTGGGYVSNGKAKSNYSFQKSKIKMDKRIQRFFNKHNHRKSSTNRCYTWR